MHLVSRNNPASMGAIVGRPTILPPSFALGDNPNNELFACALHGKGTDALRVALFQHSGGAGIERVLLGPETGDIEGSTAAALTKDWLVTAIHGKGSGRLKVMSWRVTVIGADAGLPRGYLVAVREAGTNKLSLTKWA